MIKLMGVLLIVLSGAVSGSIASMRLKEQSVTANLVYSMMIRISVLLRYNALSVYEIISTLRGDNSFAELSFLQNIPTEYNAGEDFSAEWSKAVEEDNTLRDEEKGILKSFGSAFGTTDVSGQQTLLEKTSEELKKICEIREAEYNKKGRLYRSVGILTGVMTGIALV